MRTIVLSVAMILRGASLAAVEGLAAGARQASTASATIVGGGLAGLSTAVHLLEQSDDVRITIVDKHPVGCGGASSVAGG